MLVDSDVRLAHQARGKFGVELFVPLRLQLSTDEIFDLFEIQRHRFDALENLDDVNAIAKSKGRAHAADRQAEHILMKRMSAEILQHIVAHSNPLTQGGCGRVSLRLIVFPGHRLKVGGRPRPGTSFL